MLGRPQVDTKKKQAKLLSEFSLNNPVQLNSNPVQPPASPGSLFPSFRQEPMRSPASSGMRQVDFEAMGGAESLRQEAAATPAAALPEIPASYEVRVLPPSNTTMAHITSDPLPAAPPRHTVRLCLRSNRSGYAPRSSRASPTAGWTRSTPPQGLARCVCIHFQRAAFLLVYHKSCARNNPGAFEGGGEPDQRQPGAGRPRFKVARSVFIEADHGESWLTAAIPMDSPYCSCKLTRVRVQALLDAVFDNDPARDTRETLPLPCGFHCRPG